MLLIVVSIPRRMLLKITRTPRTEIYKSVITNRCDQTFVYFLLGKHANYRSLDPLSCVTKDIMEPSYVIIQKNNYEGIL